MKLTVSAIQNLKPREKHYKVFDGEGLYLSISPAGGKSWKFSYRFIGQQKAMTVGPWPLISLADARARATELRRQVHDGIDPALEKQLRKFNAMMDRHSNFRAVAEEWLVKREKEGLGEATVAKTRWLLSLIYPVLGKRPIGELGSPELFIALKKIEATGRLETTRRLRSLLGRIFRYAVATGRASRDPSGDLRGAFIVPKATHFAAITTPSEAGNLLRAIDSFQGHEITRMALKTAPHVFLRPGELRLSQWADIDFDKAIWHIPAERAKMRRPHKVPLSRQVCDLLEKLYDLTGHAPGLFPSFYTWKRSMSENTINLALRRMGFSADEMTAHGFRAMASTLLNEMGEWHPDAIERQLGHIETNGVRRAYARGEHWNERVRMMQRWSDYLDQLRDGGQVVRPVFKRRASE